ncbi:unnamed protein product [Urochloa humidicola]
MMLARNFQEMCLKVLLDRSEFTESYVMLGNDASLQMDSTFYLLLPIKQKFYGDKFMIDWPSIKRCLSSPVFQDLKGSPLHDSYLPNESLKLLNGTYSKADVIGSLVYTPHNKLFFFVDVILDETNGESEFNGSTYVEHFNEKFEIKLSHPEQPLLKAKQLFNLRNLLHNRQLECTESEGRELMEHFVELPPELCSLKITGFSKDMGSSLSLLPSLMCRLENLLVAIELKDVMLSCFPEASQISASGILEALTTERCLERISLERFEVLGDAFLKYVVGRHNFISYEGLDEGQLTRRRSDIVNNSNLYELSIRRNFMLAAQDTLSKLKNYGYKHKSKSLEEILHAATKKESELIGYDEEPIKVEDGISLEMKNLQMNGEMEGNIFFGNNEASSIGRSKTSIQSTAGDNKVDKMDASNGRINKSNVVVQNGCLPGGAADKINKKEYHGDMVHKTARSFLYELCAANYWKPPEFELCKDEGPSHLRKFTCKALVQVMGPSATLLECYSDPKLQKKAAQEHAAQGALWCLKQLGYLPKDETRI